VPTSRVWSHKSEDKLGLMTPPPQNTLHMRSRLRRLQLVTLKYVGIRASDQWTSVQ
jgi:hypothetical protein